MRVLPVRPWVRVLLLGSLFVEGCAHAPREVRHVVPKDPPPFRVQEGTASWYGPGFHGRRTASGERFDQTDLTCAHRTLPFGTRLKVTNLRNGQEVIVVVNDRGPYVRPRILDVSKEAARVLDFLHEGTARIRLESLPPPELLNDAVAGLVEDAPGIDSD